MTRYSVTSDLMRVTVIAAAVVMSGAVVGDTRLHDTKLPIERLSRPFGIGLRQIEHCLFQERRVDHPTPVSTVAENDHKCPIEQKR